MVVVREREDMYMSKLVMVIDDSATVRKIVETCLSREGFDVESFQDGVDAIRWLAGPRRRLEAARYLARDRRKPERRQAAGCSRA